MDEQYEMELGEDQGMTEEQIEASLADFEKMLKDAGISVNDASAMTQTLGILVDNWFELKTENDNLKAQRSVITAKQDALELKIIEMMEQADLLQMKTTLGSITVKPKSMPKVTSMTDLVKWIAEDTDNRIGFLNKVVNTAAINEMLESEGKLPPGVDTFIKQTLTKRAARSK